MKLYPRVYSGKENSEDIGKAVLKLIEGNLDIKRWGFRLAFTNFTKARNITAIYNSEWCRLSFMFSYMRYPDADELSVDYGRLHAPNEAAFMEWNGEECRCWHNALVPLRFLDGLTPTGAYKQVMVDKKVPIVVRNFIESSQGKKLIDEYPPKHEIVLHNTLWKHYGKRLFELFDLRRPDLWEEYRKFTSEYHSLLGMKSIFGPPYENVC
jgi:hypothetical protein